MSTIYDSDFYNAFSDRGLRSARVVVPMLLNLVQPRNVIEVGCGRGAWLRAFQENGVNDILGLDGPWIDKSQLLFDSAKFRTVNLDESFELHDRYDLAVCLEVAEHLTPEAGRVLISVLSKAAPLVLFSAAIPYQGGTGHVNEQWPSYWTSIFSEHGFRWLDPIRRHLWQDRRVDYWYRQNILLFATPNAIAESVALQAEESRKDTEEMGWVRIEVVEHIHQHYRRFKALKETLEKLPRVGMAIRRRLAL